MIDPKKLMRAFCVLLLFIAPSTILIVVAVRAGNSEKEATNFEASSRSPIDLPFDLFAAEKDLNNIRKNPKWGLSLPDPGDTTICPTPDFYGSQCSSDHHALDKPGGLKKLICGVGGVPKERINGHVNWEVATYDGSISFNDYSDDFDWTWNLKPRDGAGLTKKNPGSVMGQPEYIHAEFDTTETVNGFLTGTWTKVRDGFECFEDEAGCLGPNGKNEIAHRLVDGKRAVVTGLIGLDSEHGGYSELHPVYAMAIEVNPDPKDDTWIVFVRNRGNEGFCSKHDHPLQGINKFMLLIPKPPTTQVMDAQATGMFSSTVKGDCPTWMFDQKDKQGEIVSFDLPSVPVGGPYLGPIVEGEIHISWAGPGPLMPFQPEQLEKSRQDQDEHFLKRLDQRKRYFATMRNRIRALTTSQFHMCPAKMHSTSLKKGTTPKPTVGNVGRRQVEKYLRENDYFKFRAICAASKNTVVGCEVFNKGRNRHPPK